MRKITAVFVCVFIVTAIGAESWKFKSDFNLLLNQSSYSDNWNGTEKSSVSWTAKLNSSAEKQLLDYLHNRNTLKLAFGQTHQQEVDDNDEKYWAKPEKSTDIIDFESMFRFTLKKLVDPFVSFRLETQFVDYSQEDNTRTFNPILLTESAGVARTFIEQENHKLSSRLGAAIRQHIDRNSMDENGDQKTETMQDAGLEFVSEYMKQLNTILTFESRLDVFQALYNSEEDDLDNEDWKATDVKWLNTLNAKIWKALTVNFEVEWVYDKEQDRAGQYRENLALGFSYSIL